VGDLRAEVRGLDAVPMNRLGALHHEIGLRLSPAVERRAYGELTDRVATSVRTRSAERPAASTIAPAGPPPSRSTCPQTLVGHRHIVGLIKSTHLDSSSRNNQPCHRSVISLAAAPASRACISLSAPPSGYETARPETPVHLHWSAITLERRAGQRRMGKSVTSTVLTTARYEPVRVR
jgi:hypothetical protein